MPKTSKPESETTMDQVGSEHDEQVARDLTVPKPTGTTKKDWIGAQLKQVFDDVANEPVPDDMLDLLNKIEDPEADKPTERDS